MGYHMEVSEAKFLDDAKDSLSEKLKDGKKVGGCDLFDLLDCELNGDLYKFRLEDLMRILTCDSGERGALADQFVEAMIDRYLDSKPELVEEEMANEIELQNTYRGSDE